MEPQILSEHGGGGPDVMTIASTSHLGREFNSETIEWRAEQGPILVSLLLENIHNSIFEHHYQTSYSENRSYLHKCIYSIGTYRRVETASNIELLVLFSNCELAYLHQCRRKKNLQIKSQQALIPIHFQIHN